MKQTCFNFEERARRDDPTSSHRRADRLSGSVTLSVRVKAVLWIVYRNPGRTALPDRGRPLESCATVFYILKARMPGLKKQRLSDRDLEIESPYNTYLHLGLPPGPICSPGESSIRAAIWPADVDYLYFVAKGDGRHHFSRTFKEHAAAKDRYQ